MVPEKLLPRELFVRFAVAPLRSRPENRCQWLARHVWSSAFAIAARDSAAIRGSVESGDDDARKASSRAALAAICWSAHASAAEIFFGVSGWSTGV
jgi:hypothetical protein